MRIILSPAKKMKVETDVLAPVTEPVFLENAREIMRWMQGLSYEQAKKLWACNDKIAAENFDRFEKMDLKDQAMLTPAVLAYDGIAFQYMGPIVFEDGHFDYVQEHLRILSGFYGVLRAMDGVVPYRLEMQAKAKVAGTKNLYDYWGGRLYEEVADDSHVIVNLASKEYSVCIEKYLRPEDRFVTCVFGEFAGSGDAPVKDRKIVQKGVYAKMARGDMVRFMAENQVEDPEQMKTYNRLGYSFCEERSTDKEYVFIKGDH